VSCRFQLLELMLIIGLCLITPVVQHFLLISTDSIFSLSLRNYCFEGFQQCLTAIFLVRFYIIDVIVSLEFIESSLINSKEAA